MSDVQIPSPLKVLYEEMRGIVLEDMRHPYAQSLVHAVLASLAEQGIENARDLDERLAGGWEEFRG